ncbi:hypothetical protein [Streptomyces sp. CA-111067]|uniref:hypothetical protein n=1 Tax=Streptomyces sp. CA-111067 TaxID=3240046 RepID=UPI003D9819CF
MTRARSVSVVLAALSYSVLAVCAPSSARDIFGNSSPTAKPPPQPASPDPTISSQVQYTRSYNGSGAQMTSSDASWSPPACWYEPVYSPDEMEQYLTTHYEAEHIAMEVIGEDPGPKGIDYHTGEKGTWWKLEVPDIDRAQNCTAQHSWLWEKPGTPTTDDTPLIDPRTLAGLAYNDTVLPAPPLTLRPAAENQLVNLDTEVVFDQPLDRVYVTAQLDNAAAGVHIAATTVATPNELRVDAGTENADPSSCTYKLTPTGGGAYSVDTSNDPCNITYRKHGDYTLQATLVWNVTWTPSANPDGPPQNPPFPQGQSTTPLQVTVKENQTIVN